MRFAFRDVLNFAESDSLGEGIAFYRAHQPLSPWHRQLAAARNHSHHLNFMVTEIDDVGRGMARLKAKDVPVVFGPAAIRHRPASSCTLDPDGRRWNTASAWREFPEIGPRAPRRLDPTPASFDHRGSYRDPRMSTTGEIAAPLTRSPAPSSRGLVISSGGDRAIAEDVR